MKYYLIAGEASGDLHGSNLIKAIQAQQSDCIFRCWGGDLMARAGAEVVKHYRDLAFMGFLEVIIHLRTILSNISFCKRDILEYNPDILVLIDYPGFNLRIAEFAKKNNIKVVYYISPQIWAWKESRVHKIKRSVDLMLTILPFEKDFYARHNYDVEYVGHPLIDAINDSNQDRTGKFYLKNGLNERPIIALLPGSRSQEIKKMLPIMIHACEEYYNYQIVIAGAPSQPREMYQKYLSKSVTLVSDQTYGLLRVSNIALVTSGTATLEAGLFKVPQVVCYKGGAVSYQIARKLIKVDYISLVNLVLDQPAVLELIQNDLTADNLRNQMDLLLNDSEIILKTKSDYDLLITKLGGTGASKRAAEKILALVK